MGREFFGKYRGRVENNLDPNGLGRMQISCPAILGEGKKSWAMPCVPYAGKDVGWFTLPPKGTQIWVEFEGGDPDYPIWSGCFWLSGQVPADPATEHIKVLKTEHVLLEINEGDDVDKAGIRLEIDDKVVPSALRLHMNAKGIEINHGDQRIVRLTEETIEIANSDQAKIVLTAEDIELATDPVSMQLVQGDSAIKFVAGSTTSGNLDGESIQLKTGSTELKMESSAAVTKSGSGTVKVSAQGVEMGAAPAMLKVEAAGIEVNDGAGGAMKLSGPAVNINNGALEVT